MPRLIVRVMYVKGATSCATPWACQSPITRCVPRATTPEAPSGEGGITCGVEDTYVTVVLNHSCYEVRMNCTPGCPRRPALISKVPRLLKWLIWKHPRRPVTRPVMTADELTAADSGSALTLGLENHPGITTIRITRIELDAVLATGGLLRLRLDPCCFQRPLVLGDVARRRASPPGQ